MPCLSLAAIPLYSRRLMISRTQNTAGLGALDTTEAVGWGWTIPHDGGPDAPLLCGALLLAAAACAVLLAGLAPGRRLLVPRLRLFARSRSEQPPETRADGIVAMTGGVAAHRRRHRPSRPGLCRRLLISGVNERTSRDEIARLNPGQRRLFDCCVDLGLPGPQHHRQRHRDPALGRAEPLPVAHRRDLELPHAAHPGGARPRAAEFRRCPIRSRRPSIRRPGGAVPRRPGDLHRIREVPRGLAQDPVRGRSGKLLRAQIMSGGTPSRAAHPEPLDRTRDLMSFGRPVRMVAEPLPR